ncbi:MAG: chromosomal replication initiator protein DnaA [Dehalococcoidia bacterium]
MLRSAQNIWQAALGELELQVNRANFRTWLQDTTGEALEGDTFVVGVPNAFCEEWLEQRLLPHIRNTLAGLLGRPLGVRFSLRAPGHCPPPPSFAGLNPAYSFGSLAVGGFNLVAHCAATEAAERPGQLYNPLLVWGGTGLGKTHLLQAVARRTLEGRLAALYLTAEQFTTQFITAIRHQGMDGFRQRFRGLGLLVVDDIQFLTGKGQTQEGFFHTFNELYNNGCQLIVASDRHPRAIEGLPNQLSSRLAGGLVAQVTPPGEAERLSILQTRVRADAAIATGVLEIIARAPVGDIRELLGRLNWVLAVAQARGHPLTPELAQQALEETTAPTPATPPQAIVDRVLRHFHLPSDAFLSRKRQAQLSLARQIAVYLLREEAQLSLSQIGALVGGLTKSSVIYAHRQTVRSLPHSTSLSRPLMAIRSTLSQ